jgi:hypothetical protein
MKLDNTSLAMLAAGLMSVLLAGCWGYRPDLPPTARVSGTITLEGAPLGSANVQFVPDTAQGTSGPPAVGFTDAQGKYELKTAGGAGAVVGKHKVRIEARAAPKDAADTLPALLHHERYLNPETSELTADVKAGEQNVADFKLEK